MSAVRSSQVGTNLCSLSLRLFPCPDDVSGVRVVRIINRKAKVMFVPFNHSRAGDAALLSLGALSHAGEFPANILAAQEPIAADQVRESDGRRCDRAPQAPQPLTRHGLVRLRCKP